MRFVFVVTLFALILSANHVSWQSDFDKAHQEALKQKKSLLVLLVEKNSPKAKEVLQKVFMNQDYIETLNSKFISVIVTKGQKKSYPIEMLYTFSYPSLFFLNSQELFLCEPIRGNVTPQSLKSSLKEINSSH